MADFLLLELLASVVSAGLCLATVRGRKDHVIDEFGNAWAVRIGQNFGDHALEKGFVLEFQVFAGLKPGFLFVFIVSRGVWVGLLLFGFGVDEAVEVGGGSVEFEGGVVFFEQLAHGPTILYEINGYNGCLKSGSFLHFISNYKPSNSSFF